MSLSIAHAVDSDITIRQVLAFYYPWWGTPAVSGHWGHWGCGQAGPAEACIDPIHHSIGSTSFYPTEGAYDSSDLRVLEQQAAEAHASGITGWVYQWWGPPGSIVDKNLPAVLATAARHNLKVAVMLGPLLQPDRSITDNPSKNIGVAEQYLTYIITQYSRNSSYLRQ